MYLFLIKRLSLAVSVFVVLSLFVLLVQVAMITSIVEAAQLQLIPHVAVLSLSAIKRG